MGPLYYAGTAAQLEDCIQQVESIISSKFLDYIDLIKKPTANPGAGEPELSRRWNRCLEAIRYLDEAYNGKHGNE